MDERRKEMDSLVFRWDVFVSFGDDTRHNFTGCLLGELLRNSVRTFLDDEGLKTGDELAPELLAAIDESAAYVAIISEKYACSGCLEELAQILERNRRLLPVFYNVDPSNVRRQEGPFEKPFRELEAVHGVDKVQRWRKALERSGGKKGWDSMNWKDDSKLVQDIIKNILREVNNAPLGVAKHPVGIKFHVEEVMKLLDLKSTEVRVIGFHGMGGIGKTTLAKAVYNKIASDFEHRCFMFDIRETSRQHNGLISLQKQLIHDLFSENFLADEVSEGIIKIKGRVNVKRVLIVLDDVDDASQLDVIAGARDWFHDGSRIIITTRDKKVLKKPFVNEIYEVKELSYIESLQLFSHHAFGKGKPADNFLHFSEQVVSLTGGLPLALEVFGALMFNKKKEKEWEEALEKLRKIQPGNLQEVLMISYNALDDEEKCVFLDIACLFVKIRMDRENAVDIFKGCGFNAEKMIKDLTDKSLIKVRDDNTLWMHDQLRDMGHMIVWKENLLDPSKHSRLWDRQAVLDVLNSRKGTGETQGIILDFEDHKRILESKGPSTIRNWNTLTYLSGNFKNASFTRAEGDNNLGTKMFQPMLNLRLLQINHVNLEGDFKHMPAGLKWLQWKGCLLEALPSNFCLRKLAVMDLSESMRIKQVWNRRLWKSQYEMAKDLRVMNLLGCCNLTATPDFHGHPKLEKLILERCLKLKEIHKSVGDLSMLRLLNLKDCQSLEELPNNLTGLRKLETLILSECLELKQLPEDLSPMKSLIGLLVDRTAVVKIPDSIVHLEKLERLSLSRCLSLKKLPISMGKLVSLRELNLDGSALEELPDSIGLLKNLESLNLARCKSIIAIPDSIGNLTSLSELLLGGCAIKELPDSVGFLSNLKLLYLSRCQSLCKLPASIGGLTSLVNLHLDVTPISELPNEIGMLNMLEELQMNYCMSLACLPISIGCLSNLTTLVLENGIIMEFPESICLLEKLEVLRVKNCRQLNQLPESIGGLKNLRSLQMEETGVAVLPGEFGWLSSLMVLNMAKKRMPELSNNTECAEQIPFNKEDDPHKLPVLPSSFSNLSLLRELYAASCNISCIPDGFEKLSSLETLNLGHNNICSFPSCLTGLSVLKKLNLSYCAKLKSLPLLPSSLVHLDVRNCTSLESICGLSNLEKLEDLHLTNCKQIVDVPGLECLNSLRNLYMSGCSKCQPVIKRRFSKVALKHMQYLSFPGSEIPDWLIQEPLRFSSRKNHKIKAVIIAVVISLDQQIQDDNRNKFSDILDIQANFMRNNEDVPSYTHTMKLLGIPMTHEDQVYLFRYRNYHPLVLPLRDGDEIQVTVRKTPWFRGLTLKKYGICSVFEDDDDYDGDEESFNESQQSVSEKLARFFSSLQ